MLSLSERVSKISPSATLQMKARTKALKDQGVNVIGLSAGEPDFETPDAIVRVAHEALEKGVSRYTATRGTDELIAAMQLKFARDQKVKYDPSQVLSTLGAKCAISMALDALVGPGDEVIVLAPYWVSYTDQVRLSGAEPIIVTATAEEGYLPSAKAIKAALTPRTKALILNSPNNPSGMVYPEKLLREIMQVLEGSDVWVISDEIYEHLVFDDMKHVSPASFSPDALARTIVVCGASKGYAMTGWRAGFVGGPKEAVAAIVKLQEQRYTCIPAITQAASAYALLEDAGLKVEIEKMRLAYQTRRDGAVKILAGLPHIRYVKPNSAFYIMLDLSFVIGTVHRGTLIKNDDELALRLLSEAHVAVVAGTPFGVPGSVRLSLASSMEDIAEGIKRIADFVAG
jgi:aspartate aminotransferase